jgi:hypothetical protein
MTTKTLSVLTIKELTARTDPRGNAARIAEVLQQKNAILEDIPWVEANESFSNRTVRRANEPSGSFRKINLGVATEASKTTPIVDTVGLLESYSKVDVRLAKAAPGGPAQFRSDEDMSFVSGMGKTIAGKLFYGNSKTTAEEFTGLEPRLDSITTNCIDAGGSGGDTTSIWIITWDLDYTHGLYGRGMNGGLEQRDLGTVAIEDSSGLINEWYLTHFIWECGLCVRNERGIGRIANIESSKTASSNAFNEDDLIDLMVEMDIMPSTRIYVNRNLFAQMWKRLKDKNNVYFTRNQGLDAGGLPISFNGVPIRLCEQIINTETAVS